MKLLEFETSKGRFLVSESDEHYDYRFIGLLSRITEEQASEIVDIKGDRFQDYNHVSCCDRWCNTAIESLHSLLKSKGIHLFENPCDNYCGTIEYQEAEQKTFYNPYIFKL